MGRHLYNPNQTQASRNYIDQNGVTVMVGQDGYVFSDDKEMDATVEFFKKEYNFVEKKQEVVKATKGKK